MSEQAKVQQATKAIQLMPSTTYAFLDGFETRFPQLPSSEVQTLANTMLGEIGRHVGAGDDLAFVRMNEDGTADLTILKLSLRPRDDSLSDVLPGTL